MGLNVFTTVFIIMLFLAVFVPYMNIALSEPTTSVNINGFQNTVNGSSYLTIALNVVTVMFWTFGLNSWINLLILLPIRIFGLISLWYIISPAK